MKIKTACALICAALLLTSCGNGAGVTTAAESAREDTKTTADVTEETTEAETAEEVKELKRITFEGKREIVIQSGTWAPRVCTYGEYLVAGYESPGGIMVCRSSNGGKSFSPPVQASFFPELNCANVNFYRDGDTLYLAYRATKNEGGLYTSLRVSVSDDGGESWRHHSTVCEYRDENGRGGVWEPYILRLNGELTCVYANDHPSRTDRQNIEYRVFRDGAWKKITIISNGNRHDSRDGMPVLCTYGENGYVCVIESTAERAGGHPFVLKLFYSKDGVKWSDPVTIYTPKTNGSKAAAPGIVLLPDGRFVISFQTDEDATVKGDATSVMKFIVSDGSAPWELDEDSFTEPENIFGTPDGEGSVWTGIFYADGLLYAAAGTRRGSSLKITEIG